MRRVGLRALLAGVVSLGLASTAWAGFGNRDDLVDIENLMGADSLDSPLTGNHAVMALEGSTAIAYGSVSVPGTGTTKTLIRWFAFEPDQTKRGDNGGQIQQKDEVGLTVVLNGTQLFSGVVPGCKAKIQAKAPKGSTLPADIDKGSWSVSCNKKANDTVGLTDQQLTDLQTALGKKVVGKGSLNIKGKCTDANCKIPLG